MWYAAHVVMVFRSRQGEQREFSLYENVFLVEADTPEQAHEQATKIGRDEEACDDPSLTADGIPARLCFAGVRKVVSCLAPNTANVSVLATGTELTYSQFTLDSEEALAKFVAGESAPVVLEE